MAKNKIVRFNFRCEQELLRVRVGSVELKEVTNFKYLGSFVSAYGDMEVELKHKLEVGAKVMGELTGLCKDRTIDKNDAGV